MICKTETRTPITNSIVGLLRAGACICPRRCAQAAYSWVVSISQPRRGALSNSMELLINTESLQPPRTGIGTYTAALLEAYSRAGVPERIHSYSGRRIRQWPTSARPLRRDGSGRPALRGRLKPMLYRIASVWDWPYFAWRKLDGHAFSKQARGLETRAVYHEPNFILKPFAGPSVVTVHDLSHLRFPDYHPGARVAFLERHLGSSLERAWHVITVSELVRRELVETFALDPSRVSSIPLGVSEAFRPADAETLDSLESKFGLTPGGYVLCIATREPRKNLVTLFQAFELLPAPLRERYPLVLCGARGWHADEIDAHAARLSRRGWLRQLDYVPESALPALYSGAAVFAFPSVYEGFGLPALEAMACGTAVVVGHGTAMAEFAGDSAVTCQAADPESLSEQIRCLLEDRQARREYIGRAIERARRFSWRRCADAHLEIYRNVESPQR